MSNDKEIQFSKGFQYKNEQTDYEFKMKKRGKWWLWLLLLPLLALLFIRCEHDITIHVIDNDGKPVAEANVQLSYISHILAYNGKFLSNDSVTLKQTTNEEGLAEFKNLRCSIFSYIFYCMSDCKVSATTDCMEASEKEHNFHYSKNIELRMDQRRCDLYLQVLDLETDDPLPDATVSFKRTIDGKEVDDSVKTDPNGRVTIKDYPACGIVETLLGSCYGYADTTLTKIPAQQMQAVNDSTTMRLRPIKKRITFFVKDVTTKQPIPGAEAVVTLTDSHSKSVRSKSTTNVDGKGQGFFEDAFILAHVQIDASKRPHYNDSTLTGSYTVDEFIKLPEEKRTVWLRPEPFVIEFENVDSITGKPLAGVTNKIIVTEPDGTTHSSTETSNRNGKFPVKAKEGAKIHIESQLRPNYLDKTTDIPSFSKPEKVKMKPDLVTLVFRTIDAENGTLVPRCDLKITTTFSGVKTPASSGSGQFEVKNLRHGERISIIASKNSYDTNSTKIQNADVDALLTATQDKRDIPMKINLPPCSAGSPLAKSNKQLKSVQSYNMGTRYGDSYSFTIKINGGGKQPDRFIITDDDGTIDDITTAEENFTKSYTRKCPVITVTVITCSDNPDDSIWEYTLSCPK